MSDATDRPAQYSHIGVLLARAKPSPTHLSYGVLAAIGESGASTPELVDMLGRGQLFFTSSPSQIYAEPKRLLALGWVTSEKRPGKTRNQTVYRLTEQGREALREHLRAPAGWPRIQHDAARRLFAGDMITDEEILASLKALRDDIEQLTAITDTNISRIAGNPHRARYALLLHDLGRRLLDAHSDWLDEVERELAPPGPNTDAKA
jgi:PadR family transcriptional regulator AphA